MTTTSNPTFRESLPGGWRGWILLLILALLVGGLGTVQARGPLAVALAGAAIVVLLERPWVGLAAFPIIALTVPFAIDTGTQSTLNAAMLSALGLGAVGIFGGLLKGRLELRVSRVTVPLLLMLMWTTVSFLSGLTRSHPFVESAPPASQAAGLAVVALSVLLFLLPGLQLRRISQVRIVWWCFVIPAALILARQFLPIPDPVGAALLQRGSAGALYWVWLVSLTASAALFQHRMRLVWRALLGMLTLAALYRGIFLAREWSSGWVPPLVSVGAIILFRFPRFTLTCTVVLGLIAIPFFGTAETFVMVGDQPYSLMTRVEAAKIALDIIAANPLLGLGPSNYYFATPLYPLLGWYVHFSFHNNFLDLAAQIGLVGLGLCLWFFFEYALYCVRMRRVAADGFVRGLLAAGFGGLAGTMAAGLLGDWFLPFVYNVGIEGFRSSSVGWLLLGVIYALQGMTPQAAGWAASGSDRVPEPGMTLSEEP